MIQVVMPMAGDGTRFSNGFKPFIEVSGRPLYQWSISSLGDISNVQLHFIIKKVDDEKFNVEKVLKEHYPSSSITVLDNPTRGALETAYLGTKDLNDKLPLTILDCDIYFRSKDLEYMISSDEFKTSILFFNSNNPSYSYCSIKDKLVTRTAEKEVISNNAITGAYCFETIELFRNHAKQIINEDQKVKGEFYISPIYNHLIKNGINVSAIECDKHYVLGTPEDVLKNKDMLK
jgi:dTDP-glucose pyrophosphorylase